MRMDWTAVKPLRNPGPTGIRKFPRLSLYVKRSRFGESQIDAILKEVELGAKVVKTSRRHGVGEPTYYKSKSLYSGMTVSHLAQLC